MGIDVVNQTATQGDIPLSGSRTGTAGLWASIRRDIKRVSRGQGGFARTAMVVTFNRGFQAMLCYRIAHALWRARVPLAPLVLGRVAQTLYGVDISHEAELGPGIVIVHGFGLVIGSEVRIEGDCYLFHGVTLGDRGSEWVASDRTDGHPTVGKEVMFGAGAKVLGPIRIGKNSVIGANAVVLKDVPPDSIVAGVPAKVVGTRPEMDENLRPVRPRPTRPEEGAPA
jgi:serine O-acetyltransferase